MPELSAVLKAATGAASGPGAGCATGTRVSASELEVVVLADTHLGEGLGPLPARVRRAARDADVVLHAGDVTSARALDELSALAPTWAVLGNNDRELAGALPEQHVLELAGVRVALLHDAGPRPGRAARLRRRFPDADVVVFGHSHVPLDERGVGGQLLFNPGSPTQRRSQPRATYGRLLLAGGEVHRHRIRVATD